MNEPVEQTAAEVLLGQLGQRSTIVALVSAVALVAGWTLSPERLDAVALLVSVADTVALAVIQERRGSTTTTTTTVVTDPPHPPVVVTTTTDEGHTPPVSS